jgi:tRNA nucleotidyltransferase (CCA-adding enzyme)
MHIYLVGGAVRDALLGLPVKDRDWVVVGATPEQLLAQGYLAVGRDFPVFLHPQTREEYALARTERSTGPGYRGFAVYAASDVTLEQDLARRDLTMNSIAVEASCIRVDGSFDPATVALVDPWGGRADLARRVFRHVTTAFREDPVRILRVARLSARFPDFTVAPETLTLMREMVQAGEADHLVPERVWQELATGLMAAAPSRMFNVLRDCGALARLMPDVEALWGVPQSPEHHPEVDTGLHLMLVLDLCARLDAPLSVRFACLCHDLGKGSTPPELWPRHLGHEARSVVLLRRLAERWRVPTACRELAEVVAREHGNIHRSADLNAAALMRLLTRCDALRQPQRFAEVLLACECDARGRLGLQDAPYPQRVRLLAALAAAQTVPTAQVAASAQAAGASGSQVGDAVYQARVAAVHARLFAASVQDGGA